jgi:hypothetical protein
VPASGTSWPLLWWTEAAVGVLAFLLLALGMPLRSEPAPD